MADGRAASVHDPAAPGDSVPAEELSVSRDWTLDSVCTPDSDPKEKKEWRQVLLHSEARKDDGAG